MVNYNGKQLLKNAIDSLVAKTTSPDYKVILVDNGSEDGSVELIKEYYPWIRLICNPENRGYAVANNQAIKSCDADYYLLLNTDTEIYTNEWLENLIRVAKSDETIGIVTCNQPRSKKLLVENHNLPYEVEFAPGSVLLIKKKTIDSIGLLDEIFTPCYFEDTDWCFRALIAGWKITNDPSTIVIHYGEATTKKTFEDIPLYFHIYVRNRIMFEIMNHSAGQTPEDLIKEMLTLGSALFLGSPEKRMQKLKSLKIAYKTVFRNRRQLLDKRRARQMLRIRSKKA
jgi:GT2 family glycosyltransferase